jgi:redox-sensing transcriptional repressor
MGIPVPAKERLLQLMRLLDPQPRPQGEGSPLVKHTQAGNIEPVTSAQVENLTGWSRDTIRKDISYLSMSAGITVGGSAGYEPDLLVPLIKKALGLDCRRKFCVVGLGRLGSAYINFAPSELAEFEFAAGFDTNVNRVEILRSPAPLYPAYKLQEVVSRFRIEIALLCVPSDAAQAVAEKCVAAGISGILNFAPVALRLPPEIAVRNMYVADELRSLAIKMSNEK